MNMTRALHCIVSGLVQGVGFRASARHAARRLGLSGWVRNLPDGRVELEAIGEDHLLGQLLEWLHRGPPSSMVERVEASYRVGVEPGDTFEIRF
jgi:acylphosphatase